MEEEVALAQRIVEPASIQARVEEPEKVVGGFFEIFISWKKRADDTPPWGSWNRAQYLDNFWREDRLLPGVIYTLVSRIGSLGWTITGPMKALRHWHAMILDSDSSWGDAIRLWAQDYLCTDVGAIMELGRDFYPDGPVRKLWHMDARLAVPGPVQVRLAEEREPRTVDLLFRDVDAIKGLTNGQFHRFCSLPSTDQYRRRLGFCFLSRALRAAKLANALTEYQEEELSKMPPEGIATVTGLTMPQVQKAMLQHEAVQQAKNQYTFPGILWMVGNSLGQEVGVKFIPFRRLWEKFDERASWEICMKTFALDAGIDVAELWQIEAHGATKAQVSIQHRKAQGKGPAEFLVDMERFLNFVVLPLGYLFAFDQPDDEQDLLKEQIRWARIKNIRELWRSDPMQGAGLIDRDQALELLAEEGVIPARFVLPPEGRLTDIQKQYFGQVGTIHSDGYLEVHRRYWQIGAQLQQLLEVNHRPFELAAKGGPGSGHFGHAGRPGRLGGSLPVGGAVPSGGWVSPPKGGRWQERLGAFAKVNGFPSDSIVASNVDRDVGGMPVMAELDRRTGKIMIHKAAPKSPKKLEPILVHELMHVKTEKLSYGELADHMRGVIGVERWGEGHWRSMKATGGVSDFAKWSWQNESGSKAVKETLSEIARLDFQGQLGGVDAEWQKLYRSVMGAGKNA